MKTDNAWLVTKDKNTLTGAKLEALSGSTERNVNTEHRWFNSNSSASVGDSCALKFNIQKLSRNNSSHCVEISVVWCEKIILLLELPAINLTWLQPWSLSTAFNVKWQNITTSSLKCRQSSPVQLSSLCMPAAFRVTQIWIRWKKCTYERISNSLANYLTWNRCWYSLQQCWNLCKYSDSDSENRWDNIHSCSNLQPYLLTWQICLGGNIATWITFSGNIFHQFRKCNIVIQAITQRITTAD